MRATENDHGECPMKFSITEKRASFLLKFIYEWKSLVCLLNID